jgi:uncharacterized membrane protein YdjX (TVP38/TMEM64 family)
VALAGGAASGLGSAVQFTLLRWVMHGERPWMRRFAPRREQLEQALKRYPSASFTAIALARATPLPDAPLKLVAACAGYPVALYFLAILLGAMPYYFAIAMLGRLVRFPVWVLVAVFGAIAVAVLVDRVLRARKKAA